MSPVAPKEEQQGKTTALQNNPFAPRQGRTLQWRDVNMSIPLAGMKGTKKIILDRIWGQVPAGRTTAILGPSGSGKSSLLNVLSGRVMTTTKTTKQQLQVQADVRLNNVSVDPTQMVVRQSIAFVAQDDSLQATATVREALFFSAKMRLSRDNSDADIQALVHRMMTELGLLSCADTIVGSALLKGISGGERKRTSVGVELITQPRLVFLDEPTSGLDSYSALQLCKVLQKVAAAGSSVLFTIHQPSSELFKMFHHTIVLKQGRVLYNGAVTALADYFEHCGFPLPEQHNLADWVLQVAQEQTAEELEAAGFFPAPDDWGPATVISKDKVTDALGRTLHEDEDAHAATANRMGCAGQTWLLFQREVTNFGRNKHALKARTAMTCAISIFIGILFFDVAQTDFTEFINIQSSFGALLMSLLANVFATTLPSLLVFPSERPVFLREYSTNHYSVGAYFMSRLSMEFIVTAIQVTVSSIITYFCVGFDGNFGTYYLVMYAMAMASTALGVLLGSSAEDPNTAMELLPGIIMPQILFAGFFVPPELIPDWLAWVRYVCHLTYAVRIVLDNEFGNGRCPVDMEPNHCEKILDNVGVDPDEIWWCWIVLVGMFVVFRFLALINLKRKAHKYY